jgi:hypothetical protein
VQNGCSAVLARGCVGSTTTGARALQMSHVVTEHGGSLKRALVEQPLGLMQVSEQGGGRDALSWRPHGDDGVPSGIGAIGLRAREGMAQRLGGACAVGGDQR